MCKVCEHLLDRDFIVLLIQQSNSYTCLDLRVRDSEYLALCSCQRLKTHVLALNGSQSFIAECRNIMLFKLNYRPPTTSGVDAYHFSNRTMLL